MQAINLNSIFKSNKTQRTDKENKIQASIEILKMQTFAGVIIEEIDDDDGDGEEEKAEPAATNQWRSAAENVSNTQAESTVGSSSSTHIADVPINNDQLRNLGEDPATIR